MAARYVRFVTGRQDPDTGRAEGLFSAAGALADSATCLPHVREELETLFAWFNRELPIPDRFSSSTSKGAWRRNTRGICWFKEGANEAIARARRIAQIVEEHDVPVTVLKTRRPGRIVYEDTAQLVAEPFADTGA